MEYLLLPEQMKNVEQITINEYGMDSLVLMERAALGCVNILHKEGFSLKKVLVVCGVGNNGADGLAIARLLSEHDEKMTICAIGNEEKATKEWKVQKEILERMGHTICHEIPEDHYTTIIDALFGTSQNRDMEDVFVAAIQKMMRLRTSCEADEKVVLSVDMPSGIHPGTGRVLREAVHADVTVTFSYKKLGQILFPGTEYCGKLICTQIGIPSKALREVPQISILLDEEIHLPERPAYSNKGTFGKVLLIAGSDRVCGAAVLSALAAFKSGCGMVKVMTSNENRDTMIRLLPEAMISVYTMNTYNVDSLKKDLEWCDCVGIGPGIGTDALAEKLVHDTMMYANVPIVLDADALTILSSQTSLLASSEQEIVITPHVGEMSRLCGLEAHEITSHLIETTCDFARSFGVTCVCKDARTVIADENGHVIINTTGNSGMATAGSGDVLTGIICALIAGGMKPLNACSLGCAIHGKAGDQASFHMPEAEMLSRDIIKYLEPLR